MPTNYPTAIDSFVNPLADDQMNNPPHAEQHADANDAVEAIQAELGTSPSGTSSTVASRLTSMESDVDGKASNPHGNESHSTAYLSDADDTGNVLGAAVLSADATAVGPNASANGTAATSIGSTAAAAGANAVAVGRAATASQGSSAAIGNGASAGHVTSTAIGASATTTAANQVRLGTATETVSVPGDITIDGVGTAKSDFTVEGAFTLSVTAGASSGTIAVNFNDNGYMDIGPLTGNITFTSSNQAAGRSITIRVENGTTLRTLTFPAGWRFVGEKPIDIAANKVGIMTVTSFGTTDAKCVAAWAVEE